jgi:hypothetical protein
MGRQAPRPSTLTAFVVRPDDASLTAVLTRGLVAGDSGTKNFAWQTVSRRNRRTAPGLKILIGLATCRFQPVSKDIRLDSLVPLVSQKLIEPVRETIQFRYGKLRNRGLKFFDVHNRSACLTCTCSAKSDPSPGHCLSYQSIAVSNSSRALRRRTTGRIIVESERALRP